MATRDRIGSVAPVAESLHPVLPGPVRDTSRAFAAALEAARAARVGVREAEQAVEAAERVDRHAAEAAALASKPMPKAVAPKARAQLDEAQRQVGGANDAAVVRRDQYLAAVREGREEIATAAEARLAEVSSEAHAALDAVESALVNSLGIRCLLRELGDGDYLRGRSPQFKPSPAGRLAERDPLAGEPREMLDALRGLLGVEDEDEA